MSVYAEYRRDRVGWFLGLTGWQAGVVAASVLPPLWAVHTQRWAALLALTVLAGVVVAVAVVPIRGRSAAGWLTAVVLVGVGGALGWTRWRSRAARGQVRDLNEVDLPGILRGVTVHDGPPWGPAMRRVAVIQHHPSRSWAVTAAVVHPGIGLSEAADRDRQGAALGELLEMASRTEVIEEVLVMVRTVPEDGAARELYLERHRRPGGPVLARVVNDELAGALGSASVRTEGFVTVVVPEARLGRRARRAGGGFDARARELASVMGEVEAHLRGGLGMTSVAWLTSPELAVACRTGFAPGDAAALTAAGGATGDPDVGGEPLVPWALAGPTGAGAAVRHYAHDAWRSASVTVSLPARGAVMGALAPVLTPNDPGERRCVLIGYPILRAGQADRQSANAEWAADLGEGLRTRLGVRVRARQRQDLEKAAGMDRKLSRGHSLTRPYAVATVTVPAARPIEPYARGLEAAVRRAGFAPVRLDLAQDSAFAAAVIPLGVSLTRTRG